MRGWHLIVGALLLWAMVYGAAMVLTQPTEGISLGWKVDR
jgi:hypothetical protein